MGFVKTMEEIAQNIHTTGELYDAEILAVYFETTPEVIEKLLPPPLEPASKPIGMTFVANYPKTNGNFSYLESALFLWASHAGQEGAFCLSMPVTNDMALIVGRELSGFPKKMAQIKLKHDGENVTGWTERHGSRIQEISANLTGTFNDESLRDMVLETYKGDQNQVIYNTKYFPAPDRLGLDYNPRLIREEAKFRPDVLKVGEASIKFESSKHDPWGDVEVVRTIGAVYSVGHNTLYPGSVVAEVEQNDFLPYCLMKVDAFA